MRKNKKQAPEFTVADQIAQANELSANALSVFHKAASDLELAAELKDEAVTELDRQADVLTQQVSELSRQANVIDGAARDDRNAADKIRGLFAA